MGCLHSQSANFAQNLLLKCKFCTLEVFPSLGLGILAHKRGVYFTCQLCKNNCVLFYGESKNSPFESNVFHD